DLDVDSEDGIIDLLEQLQRADAFGFVLVTHDLALAGRARRRYEMRQGLLEAVASDPRHSRIRPAAEPPIAITTSPPPPRVTAAREMPSPIAARTAVRLGHSFLPGLQVFLLTAAVVLGGLLLTDFAVAKYQDMQARERGARTAALEHAALNGLRGEVQSIVDVGDGRYELATYLQNVGGH